VLWQFNLNLNWTAVLVAAVVYYLMGAIIYSPLLFARPWMRLGGFTEEDMKKGNKAVPYTLAFFAALVNVVVLAEVLDFTQSQSVPSALGAALFLWSGFYACCRLPEAVFGRQPAALVLINAFYPLVGNLTAAVVLTLWPM
jgi:Protein of unknown function (DUF1761)